MAAVPGLLRAVRRFRGEVTLLPRLLITPKRTESGGQGSEHPGVTKTQVSFPARPPHVRPSMTPQSSDLNQLDEEREGRKPERPQPRQEEDPSSSSSSESSSSDSDSDQEEEEKKDPSNQEASKWPQKAGGPETPRREVVGEEKVEDIPPTVETPKHKGTKVKILHDGPHSGVKPPRGGQVLIGEDLVDVAPAVGTKVKSPHDEPQSGLKPPSGGQDLTQDLVDVAPAVDTKVKRLHDEPQSGLKPPSGGRDLTEEDLVDVAPVLGTKVESLHDEPQSGLKPPSGGRDLTEEDLVDVAPAVDTETAAQEEAPVLAEEARIASEEDVGAMAASDGSLSAEGTVSSPDLLAASDGSLSAEASVSSPDLLAASDEPSSTASLTPPPPSAAPTPEEPLDNSKYQNTQHHSYTAFTFVDYDVQLSKHRLPQPSSGRPSPRH